MMAVMCGLAAIISLKSLSLVNTMTWLNPVGENPYDCTGSTFSPPSYAESRAAAYRMPNLRHVHRLFTLTMLTYFIDVPIIFGIEAFQSAQIIEKELVI